MPRSLGEKIGEGAAADIHAWAPGRILKLFKAGVPRRFGEHEARMTRAVFAAGGPAPEVLGEVILDGRFGIVMPRLDGPTLLQVRRTGAMTRQQTGATLAALYMSVHKTPPPTEAPSVWDWIDGASRDSAFALPKHIATGILTLVEHLPAADGLCHGDLHLENVIMTADGPRIIDWMATVRACAALDLGRCRLLLTELVPEGVDPEPPRALNAAVQSEYARLAGISPAALMVWMEPYLPIVRGMALADPVWSPPQRTRLIQSLEAALRSQNVF
jgi:Ser/Thr protein kinase RdoA (MazF antagonist)